MMDNHMVFDDDVSKRYFQKEPHAEYRCPFCGDVGKYSFVVTASGDIICKTCKIDGPEEDFILSKLEYDE